MTCGTLLHAAGRAVPPHGWRDLVAREPRHLRRGLKPKHLFLSEPEFRGWTLGTRRLLTNALLYGPGLGTRWSAPW